MEYAYWQKDAECANPKKLEELQLERLKKLINHVAKIPFYNKIFSENKISAEKIKAISDLQHLPFTTKEDLRRNYPFGLFAVPLKEVVRIHASSGTTGKPTIVGYTRADIENWANLVARFLTAGGLSSEDVVQVSFGYGLFTGGFGLHYGIEKIGATVIPVSSGLTQRQVNIMLDLGATALVGTPSYALHINDVARDMKIDFSKLKLHLGFFGGEGFSQNMQNEIEKKWGIIATDNYGLSEVIGPGVSGQCLERNGLHIFEDHFIPEIIDPETGEVLPEGEKGELVLTTLTKEATPVVRYRTRDITRLYRDECPCGRTLIKMEKPSGRTDDMLIINGVNVFPSQIESVLMVVEETEPHYEIHLSKSEYLDVLEIWVEVSEKIFFDEMKKLRAVEEKIKNLMANTLGLKPIIKLVEPKTIQRSEGKAKRVIDHRSKS
jgi:phenylacetate-CoA ligase